MLIKKFEGCELKAYKCPAGVWTIGYGHTYGVKKGDIITKEQAEHWLNNELEKFTSYLENLLTVEVTENQFAALLSFIYNLGYNNLKNSTLLRKINSGDITASDEFLRWNKAGGVVLKGLIKRREEEKKLYDTK